MLGSSQQKLLLILYYLKTYPTFDVLAATFGRPRSKACEHAHRLAKALERTLRTQGVLPAHKVAGLAELVEARGARLLYLPPYSPDFNPIELAFSKLKTWLRTTQARTREALKAVIQAATDWIGQQDAKNWFDHCGYHVQ